MGGGWPARLPAAALTLFAAGVACFPVRATDTFWHLAAGRWILEHHGVPRTDPFRFTSGGRPWVDHEWLFQVLARGVEWVGGMPALVVARMVLAAALALLLYTLLRRRGCTEAEGAVIATVAVLGARPRFLVRPELPTLILLTVLLLLLEAERRRESVWRVAAMVGLTVVWVNLHGAAILAPAVAGAFLLGSRLGGEALSWRRVLGIPSLLAIALLINPYGWRVLLVAAGIGSAMRDLPAYNAEWVPAWVAPQPYLFGGIAVVAALVLAGRWWRVGIDLGALLVAIAMALVSLSAVRHQALFYAGALPLAGDCWVRLRRSEAAGVRSSPRGALAAALVALLALAWAMSPPESGLLRPLQGRFEPGFGIEPDRFPEKAAKLLAARSDIGPLFNTFAHGGYLLWRLYPPRQVFHDGRMELQPGLLREIAEARRSNVAWIALLERYGAVGGLVRYEERPRPVLEPDPASGRLRQVGTTTTNALLFDRERFALVYWDDLVMLLLDRRAAVPADLLAQEYRVVDPENPDLTVERAANDPELRRQALAEVERQLRQDPGCERARRLAARLLALGASP